LHTTTQIFCQASHFLPPTPNRTFHLFTPQRCSFFSSSSSEQAALDASKLLDACVKEALRFLPPGLGQYR
jgi:hypothetical protein